MEDPVGYVEDAVVMRHQDNRGTLLAGQILDQLYHIAPGLLVRLVRSRLEQISGGQIDYLELVDGETLQSVQGEIERPVVLATAVFFSKARLIDNIEFGPKA